MIAPASRSDDSEALLARFETMVRFNLDNGKVVPSAQLDSLANAWAAMSLGDRVAAWARWFLARGDVRYLYGRDPGGYVTEGRLCQDFATDCVLFMYRTTELARSASAREAVQFAFGTRFYGAAVERAVREDGRVDFDDPAHLEYSEEMIRSGVWGADVTAECGAALRDTVGSSRAPPDTVRFLPTAGIDYAKLQERRHRLVHRGRDGARGGREAARRNDDPPSRHSRPGRGPGDADPPGGRARCPVSTTAPVSWRCRWRPICRASRASRGFW